MVVSLPMAEVEFDDEKQQAFKEAIAQTAGQAVRADHVIIDAIEEMTTAARRLLNRGIRIEVSVNAVDKSAADAIAVKLTEEGINNKLEEAGLPPATLLEAAAVARTTNVNQTATFEGKAELPLGGPWGVVGTIVGITVLFTLFVKWAVGNLTNDQLQDGHARLTLVQDFFDCSLDWASLGGSYSEGDLAFSNDNDGVISGFLLLIATVGIIFFLVDLYCYCSKGSVSKNVLIFKLGLEDFPQTLIYSVVLASQAQKGLKTWGMVCGLVQSLVFCAVKFTEIWSMMNRNTD